MESHQRLTTEQLIGIALAAALYVLWAVLLFAPHAHTLASSFRLLYAVNPTVAAMGIFFLSRRWISGWMPSAIVGLLYGFGPFGLSFIGFHPLAGLTYAAVPWLLLPAIYWRHGTRPTPMRFFVRTIFCILPFVFIVAFFWTFRQHWAGRLFLLPRNITLSAHDFLGLVLPMSMIEQPVVIGLYHFGLIASLMGAFVYISAQRVAVLIPPAVGLMLAFLGPVLGVGPVVWAAFPMVFVAVLAGLGLQSLLWAGKSDSKWILSCAMTAVGVTLITFALHAPSRNLSYTFAHHNPVSFYLAASVILVVLFVLSRSGLRLLPVRWMLITALAMADCYFSARWFVDRLL